MDKQQVDNDLGPDAAEVLRLAKLYGSNACKPCRGWQVTVEPATLLSKGYVAELHCTNPAAMYFFDIGATPASALRDLRRRAEKYWRRESW